MIKRDKLTKYLNDLLDVHRFSDYGPNGLQVNGAEEIKKVAFAVSATKESIEQSVAENVDALVVHHGLFWKFHGARTLTGPFGHRVLTLARANINLYGFHLPLDAHIDFGNAASLAKKLNVQIEGEFGDYEGSPTGVHVRFDRPMSYSDVRKKLEGTLNHSVIHAMGKSEKIETMGIITGGANRDWKLAKKAGLDAYLTGEISEHDWHEASESGVHYFAGGHHATEQFGVQSLQKLIEEKFNLECVYLPSDNPA